MFTAALLDDAMADNSPLFKTISRYLNEEMLAAIAKGYDEGRLLLIGSTNLDAQQPVIWNIGAIAKSGHPKALDTIRRVLLASAAVPGAFPPTMFDVTLDGKPYQEMHVDGGAFAQAFLYPAAITRQRRERISQGQQVIPAVAYIIRNGRLGSGVVGGRAAHDGYRRARNLHHDHGQRLQRRCSHVQQYTARRDRLQLGLHRLRLYQRTTGTVRSRIHARLVRLRLPTRGAWV